MAVCRVLTAVTNRYILFTAVSQLLHTVLTAVTNSPHSCYRYTVLTADTGTQFSQLLRVHSCHSCYRYKVLTAVKNMYIEMSMRLYIEMSMRQYTTVYLNSVA